MKLSKIRAAHATRHLAGAIIPRQDTTSAAMRAAMKSAKGAPYAGEAGSEVEGQAARVRLDRPGRKWGGRAMAKAHDKARDNDHDADDAYAKGGATKWIQGAIKHPGALRKSLHVKEGEPIPAKKLDKAAHSSNPTLRKRAALAKTLKGMHR